MSEAQTVLVQGERDAVATLIRNLVDNAVRYTPESGRVDVSVERSAATPAQAVIRVTDNGPGIAQDERDRVFDRFYRQPGTRTPGSGLPTEFERLLRGVLTAITGLVSVRP